MSEQNSKIHFPQVILASPYWGISGVNIFSANLVQGLTKAGISSHILLSGLDELDSEPMLLALGISIERLPLKRGKSWRGRWLSTIDYLEERQPCIYIPNADFWHSCVSSKLSKGVGIIGVVHSDDSLHYDHVARLGKYWNAIVAVSETIARKTAEISPEFAEKTTVIPCCVSCPEIYPKRIRNSDESLKVVYAGRLVQSQKRVLDLPKIVEATLLQKVPIELYVIGAGADQLELSKVSKHLEEQGSIHFLGTLPNEEVLKIFRKSDVFVLTSDCEGMPVSLLEAMGQGCVPVVTDLDSGIPEIIQDGHNGYRVSIGDIQKFAEYLTELYQNPDRWQEMSLNAYCTIEKGGYQIQDMVNRYVDLFHCIVQEMESDSYKRPKGRIIPPPMLQGLWKKRLPKPILDIARSVKNALFQ